MRRSIVGAEAKTSPSCTTFHWFLPSYWLHQLTKNKKISACLQNRIMMLCTDTRSMEWLTDGGTDFFKITSGVLQGNTLVPYLFSICLEYVLRRALGSNLEEGFTLHIAGSRRYFDVKIIDADYSDDLAVLSDRLKDATRLLHHSEKAANEVGLNINSKNSRISVLQSTSFWNYQITEK